MDDTVRIDKWLWAARFFKTRTQASDAVEGGKVRLDGNRVKPSRNVKVGDRLDIDNGSTLWEVLVTGLADQRGSAAIAQTLYQETQESVVKRAQTSENRRLFQDPAAQIKGRPTKRDRRRMDGSSY